MLRAHTFPTPLGEMLAAVDEQDRVVCLEFVDGRAVGDRVAQLGAAAEMQWSRDGVERVRLELTEYLAGQRREFTLGVEPQGTPFQLRVWEELRHIPRGTTLSYQDLANRLGQPGAVRAVGQANGANPVAIIIPCHRVVGADGQLVGYAGGLPRKRALLELEGVLSASFPFLTDPAAALRRR